MSGRMLIAEPFQNDPNFSRTVVLLCEHENDGSLGFILNRPLGESLGDILPETEAFNYPVYVGGPVQLDSLHLLHSLPDVLGGMEIMPGVYWGGDFDTVVKLIKTGVIQPGQIRFFLGYSGWNPGQLKDELKEHSWYVSKGNSKQVFNIDEKTLWPNAMKALGPRFAAMANFPINPMLN